MAAYDSFKSAKCSPIASSPSPDGTRFQRVPF